MWTRTDDKTVNRVTADVTASEIGCYSYCAKAWHLQYVAHAPSTRDASDRQALGVYEHNRHGARVRRLTWLGQHAHALMAALLLLAVLAGTAAFFAR